MSCIKVNTGLREVEKISFGLSQKKKHDKDNVKELELEVQGSKGISLR